MYQRVIPGIFKDLIETTIEVVYTDDMVVKAVHWKTILYLLKNAKDIQLRIWEKCICLSIYWRSLSHKRSLSE